MQNQVCVVPVCPVRAEASHRSEQTTQLLFGEAVEVLETSGDFVRIVVQYDGYEGWCQSGQLKAADLPHETKVALAGQWINRLTLHETPMQLPFGSVINDDLLAALGAVYHGESLQPGAQSFTSSNIREIANLFLNTPYLWGGRSVFGIDCSGFTQLVFKCFNITLPRDAYQQAVQGEAIGFLEEGTCGDLAFFDNEAGRITHVGILCGDGSIIHASGKVRTDKIDNFGIVNSETGKRTHGLRIIKRFRQA